MPLISSFLKPKPPSRPTPSTTTYFLSPSSSSSSSSSSHSSPFQPAALHPFPPTLSPNPTAIPPSTLLFALTHPTPAHSKETSFFLTCLPDPIGFLHHAACWISSHLTPCASFPSSSSSPDAASHLSARDSLSTGTEAAPTWRHQLIHLELEDKPGLAATSGGRIGVSLHWVGNIMRDVRDGKRDPVSAGREFKGVLLHELVHVLQHDGFLSTPGWLIESIADLLRLEAQLDPPHWRKPGQGRRERGWEEAYDAGARFLAWLTGFGEISSPPARASQSAVAQGRRPTPNSFDPAQAVPPRLAIDTTTAQSLPPSSTQYPTHPFPPSPISPPPPTRPRRPPMPELIRLMDARLEYERWDDRWWEEMAGARLEVLWKEYLDYYN